MNFNGQTEEKWGLCFAGGGGKGAYEIGVWKALEECTSIKFQAVSGASVGALNAALFATMKEEMAEEIWTSIKPEMLLSVKKDAVAELLKDILISKIVHMSLGSVAMSMSLKFTLILQMLDKLPFKTSLMQYVLNEGVFSREGLEKLIVSSGVLDEIGKSPLECFVAVCDVQDIKNKVKYLKLNELKKENIVETLLASSALPLVYGKQEVGGRKFRDGGLMDNLPIAPLYSCGCSHIIAIHLETIDYAVKSLKSKGMVLYEGACVWNIYPRRDLKGIFGTLDFTPKTIQKLITYGYEDMMYYIENSEMRLTHLPKSHTII